MRSAPASSTASTSAPSRAKSAESIEGAIHGDDMWRVSFSCSRPGQPGERLAILSAGARDDVGRELRSRRALVPVERLEIVAHELLVEAWRALARAISIGGPEARGIRGEHLVDEREGARGVHTELELGVGDDDAALAGVRR